MPPLKKRVHEKGTLSLTDILYRMKKTKGFQKTGAFATFVGVVRGENAKGERVEKLVLEAYEEKANEVLEGICSDLRKKPGVVDVQIHHLLGEFCVGEDIVYVLVAGSHREHVFPVLREAVERYKREAPIFKKEVATTAEGKRRGYWITERRT